MTIRFRAQAVAIVSAFWAFFASGPSIAEPPVWQDVERIVAIGDVHGDFEAFEQLLLETGVINKRGRWRGGKAHLVQVGDLPDRGPDTRKAMDLLMKLERQAKRAGGHVHALMGNHEAMNIQGDLRYVHAGEYQAFVDRRSKKRQDTYYERTLEYLTNNMVPEELPVFDEAYRTEWELRFPLGYVEHRIAWAADGDYGKWVLGHDTIIQINDTLFVHGGISPEYTARSFEEINETVRSELASGMMLGDLAASNDPNGPLWYRGLSQGPELCETEEHLTAMLATHSAKRIVVAHTPLAGAILPRFDGHVILVDVGLSSYYGGARAALIIEGGALLVLHEGKRISLDQPLEDYLVSALEAAPEATLLAKFMRNRDRLATDEPVGCAVQQTIPVTPEAPEN